jgi:hypothetical protein
MPEKTVKLYCRIDEDAFLRLKEMAAADKRTPAGMAKVLLERAIENATQEVASA